MTQRPLQTLPPLSGQPLAASTAEVDKLFRNAKSRFLTTLTPQERDCFTACNSADQLLSDIKALENIPKSRRGLPLMRRIKDFSDCLSPYFKIVEIVCQSNPEWSCVAWGALRLVLELASNFATFFEKLSKMIERLTMSLPRYAELYQTLCSGQKHCSPRFTDSLVKFYVDLLEFFQAVARVFSRPNGKLKRSPAVIADLLWRPFDVRFQDILERMDWHQDVLKEEFSVAGITNLQVKLEGETRRAGDARAGAKIHMKLSETIQEMISEGSQRAFRVSMVTWLASPSFKDNFENALDIREEGTAEWLFEEPNFKAWECSSAGIVPGRDRLSDAVLWIRGNPGWGKTVAAASIIDELESRRLADGAEPLVCYYFFNDQDPLKSSCTRLAAYRAIVLQIFQKCYKLEEIHNIFAFANDGSKSFASELELRDLLRMIMPLLSGLYLVFDGLDECDGVAKLMEDIRCFCGISSAKIILFSRPHVAHLRSLLNTEQTITMSRSVMTEDIHILVRGQLELLHDRNRFPTDADFTSMENKIVEQADGMFLWARLMMRYLDSPALTKSERMSTIFRTTPTGLREMYDRILGQITLMDDVSQQLASSVFTWISYAKDDLTAEECSDALLSETEKIDASEKKDYVDNAVIVVCCGLVEKMQNSTLRFIHSTVRDHLLSSDTRVKDVFGLTRLEAQAKITTRCLSYLLFSVPAQPLSGNVSTSACKAELRGQYPLLLYATVHWAKHLQDGLEAFLADVTASSGLEKFKLAIDMLEKFLGFPLNLMVWIEATYLFNKQNVLHTIDAIVDLLRSACRPSSIGSFSKIADELSSFAHDLREIDKDWRETLFRSSHEIWGDISAFANSRFLAQNRGIAIQTLAPSSQDHPTQRIDPLFCISANNSDSSFMAKLSIYPSFKFDVMWKTRPEYYNAHWDQQFQGKNTDIQEYCTGWLARYEIYQLSETAERLFYKTINLTAQEIALQLQYSFRLSPTRHWKLKFPLAISPDLCTIAILGTITTLDYCYQRREGTQQLFSVEPRLDFHGTSKYSVSRNDFSLKLPYVYEWTFSSDARFTVFRDWNNVSEGSLAIFRLTRTSSRLESVLVKDRKFQGNSNSTPLRLCAMHPFQQKLLFLDRNELSFLDLDSDDQYLTNISNPVMINKLEISQCGKYYIFHKCTGRPEIYPLPWNSSDEQQSLDSHVAKRRKLDDSMQSRFNETISTFITGLNTISSSSAVVDFQANTVLGISQALDSGPRRIQLTNQGFDDGAVSSINLVNMPNGTDLRSTYSATLKVSDGNGERLRILLNPVSQSTYESDTPMSKHLPAVIDRDVSLLQPDPYQIEVSLTTKDITIGEQALLQ